MSERCPHPDVRYFEDEKGAIACMKCGRLFGHLKGEQMTAYNPPLPDLNFQAGGSADGGMWISANVSLKEVWVDEDGNRTN